MPVIKDIISANSHYQWSRWIYWIYKTNASTYNNSGKLKCLRKSGTIIWVGLQLMAHRPNLTPLPYTNLNWPDIAFKKQMWIWCLLSHRFWWWPLGWRQMKRYMEFYCHSFRLEWSKSYHVICCVGVGLGKYKLWIK